jgi:16S rRNA G966 N2-methylase RsmD
MTEPYGWPYCVERMRPRAGWRAIYDELYAGLASGEDALSRDAASLVLLERRSVIMEALRREVRNARRKERYGERYRIRQAERGAHVYPI